MKIFAISDPDVEEFDPVDPLGSICIRDDDGGDYANPQSTMKAW
jgi:hypothetical protein